MPAPALQDMAKKAKVSLDKAEEYWDKAKKIAVDEFGPETKEGYWPYVMGILKNMLGIKSSLSNKELRQLKANSSQRLSEFALYKVRE